MKKNGYPLLTIKQLMKEIEEMQKQKEATQTSMTKAAKCMRPKSSPIPITFCMP